MPTSEREKLLRATFRDRAFDPDTLFLLNAQDALAFLDAGREAGLAIAGVDGFTITDVGAYQPRDEFSNDYADYDGSRPRFEQETKALIRQGERAGIRFQVVFEGDE